jgi:hypothetical protein
MKLDNKSDFDCGMILAQIFTDKIGAFEKGTVGIRTGN